MKRLTWLKGAVVVALLAGASWAPAADHLDGAGMMKPTPSEADITDVYSWMDGGKVVLVMDVAPLATNMSKFSDKVQYVFHTESTAAFGSLGKKMDIIATFEADQTIQVWLGDQDYVTGDASATTGLKSQKGMFTVFAGLRDDPFYFNLDGFKDTVATVDAVEGMLSLDIAGCPTIDPQTSAALVKKLSTDPTSNPPGGPAKDFFAGKNVLSIVLTIDKAALTTGGAYMNVWGSTNQGS